MRKLLALTLATFAVALAGLLSFGTLNALDGPPGTKDDNVKFAALVPLAIVGFGAVKASGTVANNITNKFNQTYVRRDAIADVDTSQAVTIRPIALNRNICYNGMTPEHQRRSITRRHTYDDCEHCNDLTTAATHGGSVFRT